MLRRAIAIAALFCVPLLAGCAEDATPADTPDRAGGLVPNVGGSDKVVTSVFPGTYDFKGPYSRVLSKGSLEILPGARVTIPSPIDGSDIEMGLNLPDTAEKVPILLFASPYFFAEGSPGGTRTVLDRTGAVGNLVENFVPHGYAVVTLAVRGTAGSSGCNDLMGPDEITDLDEAVTWLGQQDWSAGAIAMTGVSYDGSTPWSVASTGNPYLKTIIPVSGVPDIYGLMYRNGSSEQRGPLLLNALYIEGSYASGSPADIPARICPEAYEGLALSGAAGVLGVDPTGYWQARNRKPAVETNYKGSILSVQGLQDWNVDPSQVIPWVDQLEASGLKTKQMLGQWPHAWADGLGTDGANIQCDDTGGLPGACVRADWQEILLHWLDSELKGLDVDTGAAVQVRDDLGRWRNEDHYPPHDTVWTRLNLNHGLLTTEAGPAQSFILYPQHNALASTGLPPDPPSAADVSIQRAADFALGPVAEDTLIVGLPKVHVTVTPQGPGGYMGATIVDVAPDGSERFVGWTSMNLAFSDGGTDRSEVVPNMPLDVKMEIQPMDSVIAKGHQVVLRLWVMADRDRIGGQPSTVTLETGEDGLSLFLLPTVVRAPEVYFTPPMPK